MRTKVRASSGAQTRRKWFLIGVAGVLAVALALTLTVTRPWDRHYSGPLAVGDAFTSALMDREAGALEQLADPMSADAAGSVQRIIKGLPEGELFLTRVVYQSSVSALWGDLEVTVMGAGVDRTVVVGVHAQEDGIGNLSGGWVVTFD